ncbi:MAG: beta-ketoacyl-ACP synthase III [Gemmatimonadaceae bacterium]
MTENAYITNVASFLPGAAVSNDQMEERLGLVGGKPSRARRPVLRSNGIMSRHYAIDPATGLRTHTNAALAAEAVRLLDTDAFSLDTIDCLACGTSVPDQLMPNHACMVHGEIASPPCEVMSASGVCLSGLIALKYATMGVKSGEFRHAVAVASEVASAILRARFFEDELDAKVAALEEHPAIAFEKDFLRWMLSDGAGAALVEPAPAKRGLSLRIDWILERSYANEIDACMYQGAEKLENGRLRGWMDYEPHEWLERSVFAIKQDVKQLNEHIVHFTVERGLGEVQRLKGLTPSQVDWFLPHYSSSYFRDKLAAGMENVGFTIPKERWFTNLTTKGNTGSAAMFIMLDELFRSGQLKLGQRLLAYVPESGRFSTGFMHLTVCDAGHA